MDHLDHPGHPRATPGPPPGHGTPPDVPAHTTVQERADDIDDGEHPLLCPRPGDRLDSGLSRQKTHGL